MLRYISLALCLVVVVRCKTPGDCFSQPARQIFCASRCNLVTGAVEAYFGTCRSGVCCCDQPSACENTDRYSNLCAYEYLQGIPFCQYRATTCASVLPVTDATTTTATTATTVTDATTTTATTATTTTATTVTTTATTTAPAPKCGQKGTVAKRIVGGTDAKQCEYPWQVPVYVRNSICGGTIIDATTIVTAAHCIQPDSITAADIGVSINEYSLATNTDQTDVTVESFVVHPGYNSTSFQNDIAIIKLAEPIEFGDCAAPVCLPSANEDFTDLDCEVSGWGTTSEDGSIATILQKVTLPVLSKEECQVSFGTEYFTDNNLCAGVVPGGKDACQGDSGGPLVCPSGDSWVLAGVVSWGEGCARPGTPGVYTNVPQYLDWIAANS